MSFVHLHVHSEFSLLDGASRVDDIVKAAVADGQTACAVTDHGSLGAAFRFRKAALKAGIKPIIGMEAYLAIGDDRFNPKTVEVPREGNDDDDGEKTAKATKTKSNEHLTILATSPKGWRNLVAIHNKSQLTFKGKALADYRLLKEHGEDLIVLTGCLGGPVAGPIARGDEATAQAGLDKLIDAVGKDNVYVEIMQHGIAIEEANPRLLAALAHKNGLELVATNDSHFTHAEDAVAHEAWLAIQSGKTLADPKRFQFHGEGYHLRTEAEMRAIFDNDTWQRACDNTQVIADRCADDPFEGLIGMRLPKFPKIPEGHDAASYLKHLTIEGAKAKYGPDFSPELKKRLRHETDVINDMGVPDYMLMGWDLLRWSRENKIAVGRGRGSVGGSALAYCLDITGVEPLTHNLLFERFLEPGRVGMPDIDFDFEARRRQEVLGYVMGTYGEDKVARVGTYGVARSRRAIKDAARVLGLTPIGNKLSAAVPVIQGTAMPFAKLRNKDDPKTAAFYTALTAAGDQGLEIVRLAAKIEGIVNGQSIHACATVVSNEPLIDLIPMRYERKDSEIVGLPISCWDGGDVEAFGLLKLDVLGLNNLDIVSAALNMIEETTGVSMTMDELPDPDTQNDHRVNAAWDLISSGKTAGLFQLESAGMQKVVESIAPHNLDDLSAAIALFRPGPLSAGSDRAYAERKNSDEPIDYTKYTQDAEEAKWLHTVMGQTQGVFVFQETLMLLGTVVSGFDVAERSALRKAVGKKIPELMAEVGGKFRAGATQEAFGDNGNLISPVFAQSTADKIWEDMKGSASYLFNASHSATYAVLAFITAYLKANWPVEYSAAVLASVKKEDKRLAVLDSVRAEGIKVLAPDVNISGAATGPRDGAIRFGMGEIKGVGKAAQWIVHERDHVGEFTSLADLMTRVKVPGEDGKLTSRIQINTVEALIEAGACDSFGPRLGQIIVLRALRDRPTLPIPDAEWGVIEKSARQRLALGVALDVEHPMEALRTQFAEWVVPETTADGKPIGGKPTQLDQVKDTGTGSMLAIGLVARWDVATYAQGTRVNFTIEDQHGSLDGVVWNDDYRRFLATNDVPHVGSVIAMSGRVRTRVIELETEDESGEIMTEVIERREITASRMWPVKTSDPVTVDVSNMIPLNLPTSTQAVLPAPVPKAKQGPELKVIEGEGQTTPKPKVASVAVAPAAEGELACTAVYTLCLGQTISTAKLIDGEQPDGWRRLVGSITKEGAYKAQFGDELAVIYAFEYEEFMTVTESDLAVVIGDTYARETKQLTQIAA